MELKDVLFICESEEHAYVKEYIELTKVRTLRRWQNYYNIGYGGNGFTSDESRAL